tara:strand:+ start:976 stop:1200 length:225 start_codon:yes stop_codon:yes gene_type:complete
MTILDSSEMNKQHHNAGRRHAAKPESEKATATIQMRCHPEDKALIIRNLKHGETIASFMLGLAVEEAEKRQRKG